MKYVIAGRKSEDYDPNRLARSVLDTCRAVRVPDGEAEDLAARAVRHVNDWLSEKTEVTTMDIRQQTAGALDGFCPSAAQYFISQGQMI